jgi:hypothetical protein
MGRLAAAPQANEEPVKIAMQVMSSRLRPNRAASQPVAGSMMAFDTR